MNKLIKKAGFFSLLFLVLGSFVIGGWRYASNNFEVSKNVEIYVSLLKKLHNFYVDEINTSELVKTGINAMLKDLDPYTSFISESEIEDYRMQTTGEYGGIGAIIGKQGEFIQIREPYEGFPAFKADVRAGDLLKKVDDESIKGKSTNQVSQILKGQPGTDVNITIERPGVDKTLTKTLTRQKVKMPNVTYSGIIKGENMGYIKYKSFRQNSSQEVKKALQKLKEKRDTLSGLVLDLRNNPGGILKEAVKTVGLFVEKGELVVKTKGKIDQWNKEYNTTSAPVDKKLPLTVLVNGNSASASEIVSGSVQDYDRGVVVGQQTYGKGLVQQAKNLPYNSKIKLTIAKYYIPSGRCIQARDISGKNEEEIADSSQIAFETQNGRTVYDADGITPDVKASAKDYPKIIQNLIREQHHFDFATLYRNRHDSIAPPDEFKITDKIYNEFKAYLEDQDYQYQTKTEKKLTALKESAKNENYYEAIDEDMEALKSSLEANKESDLKTYREDISELLESEIVMRYYHQDGRIEASLDDDRYVKKAVEILNDPERYHSILQVDPKN